MPGTLVNGVKAQMLDERVSNPPYDTLEMGLFTGSTVITPATVLGDLTEVTGTGYARQTITGWSAAILLGDNHAYSQATVVTFGPAGAGDWDEATGWFWVDTTLNQLVAAARFTLPFTLPNGESFPFAPYDTLTGE